MSARERERLLREGKRERLVVEAVAQYVEQFDRYVLHEYRLSDCIRAKFNIRPGKKWMRKNPNGWTA